MTVVFCDLVGSTALSDVLDPEDFSDVMHGYYDACRHVVERQGGWIADYLGDGLVVYFGYPNSHEDDPIRAVRTGLGLVKAVADLGAQLPDVRAGLQCRVGIETGVVVIGESRSGESKEQVWALGRTVNVAARIQTLAAPGDVVIGEGTRPLVEGWFVLDPADAAEIRGIAKPVSVSRVSGETGATDRIRAAQHRGLGTFINREAELSLLNDSWERARRRSGSAVLLRGEAGIGKSRLAVWILDRARETGARVADLHCTQDDVVSPLRAVAEFLRREIGFTPHDDANRRLLKLRDHLGRSPLPDPNSFELLAEVLVPEARRPAVDALPEERRYRAMRLLCDLLVAGRAPTLLVIEDLHWADPSTAELIGLLIERIATARALMIATTRPEFEPAWAEHARVMPLEVRRLESTHTAELAASVAGARLPREAHALIYSRSDGVPLFVEELTRMVLDAGIISIEEGRAVLRGRLEEAVPGSVYDLLAARLGRLGEDSVVAQLGSVLGHEFGLQFLRTVAPDEPRLEERLGRLVAAGVVRRREDDADTFRFTHPLIRDAVYGLLPRKRRRELHGRVADALIREYPDLVDARPELAAPHFTESGRVEEAIEQWTNAGERAAAQHALHEAIDHYQRAVDLVRSQPGSPDRARKEIQLSFALGPLIQNATGFGDPRVAELLERVSELSHWLDTEGERFTFLAYGYATAMVTAHYEIARTTAAQLVDIAEPGRSSTRKLLANCFYGTTLFQLGRIAESMPYIQRSIDLYDPVRHESLMSTSAIDPGTVTWGYRAWGEWHLGLGDTARRTAGAMLEMADAHPHPFRAATAHVWAAGLAYRSREVQTVEEQAARAIEIAAERGYEELERYALCLHGWAVAMAGDPPGGAATIRRGLDLVPHGGSRAHLSWHLALLAEAELADGAPERAGEELRRAEAFVAETSERVLEPELLRLRALVELGTGGAGPGAAAAALTASAEAARAQSSPFLELRALTALYRLRGDERTRSALGECLSSLREGLLEPDVIEATTLLEED